MTPRTELDRRYSGADAQAAPWEAAAQRLADAEVAWIVTVRSDGRPHATPMVPVVHAGSAYFLTGTGEVKYANLQGNPQVLVLAGDTGWETGLDVVLEGTAVQVTDGALLRDVAELYRDRWDGRWQIDSEDFGGVVFGVTPTRAYAHAKGDPFGHTRYRF